MRYKVKLSWRARGRVNGPVRTVSVQVKAADKTEAGAIALSMQRGLGWKVVSAEPLSFLQTEREKLLDKLTCVENDCDDAEQACGKARDEVQRLRGVYSKAFIEREKAKNALADYDAVEESS